MDRDTGFLERQAGCKQVDMGKERRGKDVLGRWNCMSRHRRGKSLGDARLWLTALARNEREMKEAWLGQAVGKLGIAGYKSGTPT